MPPIPWSSTTHRRLSDDPSWPPFAQLFPFGSDTAMPSPRPAASKSPRAHRLLLASLLLLAISHRPSAIRFGENLRAHRPATLPLGRSRLIGYCYRVSGTLIPTLRSIFNTAGERGKQVENIFDANHGHDHAETILFMRKVVQN